ncbi:hypothetical protein [Arthrobacter oryzae]
MLPFPSRSWPAWSSAQGYSPCRAVIGIVAAAFTIITNTLPLLLRIG